MIDFLTAKPVLIGLHLGFAIVGIDGFLWLLGELWAGVPSVKRKMWAAMIGTLGCAFSWIFGGYYYVKFYGTLVKPVILKGLAPWAHAVIMETKEHIFLFVVPLAVVALFVAMLDSTEFDRLGLRGPTMRLVGLVAGLGLAIGAMGFIISAAARWG